MFVDMHRNLSNVSKVDDPGPCDYPGEPLELPRPKTLEYKDVLERCKKKRALPQKKLQDYINSCKEGKENSFK